MCLTAASATRNRTKNHVRACIRLSPKVERSALSAANVLVSVRVSAVLVLAGVIWDRWTVRVKKCIYKFTICTKK